MITLSSDVSIRTSSHHGSFLKSQYEIWGHLLHGLANAYEPDNPVLWAMGDVTDELPAAVFDMLQGFYRQAVASLRSALELATEGCALGLASTPALPVSTARFSFNSLATEIFAAQSVKSLELRLEQKSGRRLFDRVGDNPGFLRDLYARLSTYAHGRKGHTLADIRQSNGPIYVGAAILNFQILFIEVVYAACILTKIGRPKMQFPNELWPSMVASEVIPDPVVADAIKELYSIHVP